MMPLRCTLALLIALASATLSQAAHRYNASDVALHLQHCFGVPVFFTSPWRLQTDSLPSCDRGAVALWLRGHDLKTFGDDTFLLIDAPETYSHHETLYSWEKLKFELSVRTPTQEDISRKQASDADRLSEDSYPPVIRALSGEELKRISDWVLKEVPMPVVNSPEYCPSCGDPPNTALLKLGLYFEAVTLSRNSSERLIGELSSEATSYVIMVERRKDSFHLDWTSPLLSPDYLKVTYRDVNADGVAEIWCSAIYIGLNELVSELSIFDVNGVELTRQAGDCQWPLSSRKALGAEEWSMPTVCPIVGLPGIDHFLEGDGTVSLLAYRDFRGNVDEPRRYRFVASKYVLESKQKAVPEHRASAASDLNSQGLELMTERRYLDAADRFVKAAELKPTNSEFANNAAYAFYKLADYDKALLWTKRAIQVDPKRAVAYLNLGDIYVIFQRNSEARQAYSKYLELAPNSKSAPDVKKKLEALPPAP